MRKAKRIDPPTAPGLPITVAVPAWWMRTGQFGAQHACLDSGGHRGSGEPCRFEYPKA